MIVVRLIMLYGLENWVIDRQMVQYFVESMSVVEINMLRWSSELTREDRIMKKYMRGSTGVVSIENRMKKYTEMVWVCDEARGNKISRVVRKMNIKGGKRKKKTKKEKVGYN